MKTQPTLKFRALDLDANFERALAFRRDSYLCSFGRVDGFWDEVGIQGALYRAKLAERMHDPAWGYFHAWHGGRIVGQVEFKDFSGIEGLSDYGYVHLFYLVPSYRGRGLFKQLEGFVFDTLRARGRAGAVLSVARGNAPALAAYRSHGWRCWAQNPKHEETNYFAISFL